eukprot:scaffold2229_cov262-Pinguiococcus_pyrenoidosus.AAC.7
MAPLDPSTISSTYGDLARKKKTLDMRWSEVENISPNLSRQFGGSSYKPRRALSAVSWTRRQRSSKVSARNSSRYPSQRKPTSSTTGSQMDPQRKCAGSNASASVSASPRMTCHSRYMATVCSE